MVGDNGHNRWFDSGIQVIVNNAGKVGVNGEHSCCDAVVPARIFDDIVNM